MNWLPSLKTETPEDGYQLAIKMSRMGAKFTQPDDDIRKRLRDDYANNADSITLAAQVIAIHFQTVAQANGYWMK